MNAVQEMNRDLGRSFIRTGIIILVITVVVLAVKSMLGYVDVKKYETFDNCKVSTDTQTVRTSRGNKTTYFVRVEQTTEEGRKLLFYEKVPVWYYDDFTSYTAKHVTFYQTSWGRKFPVKNIECTQTQAEHEYRKLDPPIFWYGLYIAGAAIGMLMLASGLKASKTARNYSVKSAYEFTHDDIALGNHSDEGITHYDAIATLEQARLRTENREARRYRPYNRRW
ncbi:hypothetical protein [Ruminococcus sp.]|uniref:hypothetical protein n=1 Tax=Ruminococcus sp. TaxID=41978 RepID=UPI0025D3D4B8|nr:hypothetical protein [Ruminococcus sp.]MBQ8965304.1 hypothetical protein [Ruminococcus sp.]